MLTAISGTGDLFEIAEDDAGSARYYRFVGRAKDLIIRGGMNIAPEEIEGLIASHPMVAEIAVIGYPDLVMGEKVRAVVTRAATPSRRWKTSCSFSMRGKSRNSNCQSGSTSLRRCRATRWKKSSSIACARSCRRERDC